MAPEFKKLVFTKFSKMFARQVQLLPSLVIGQAVTSFIGFFSKPVYIKAPERIDIHLISDNNDNAKYKIELKILT